MAKLSKFLVISIMALLCITAIGSATVMGDMNRPFNTVQVQMTGTMQLGWYTQTDNITVAANFTANVPPSITDGTYNGTFQGFARVGVNNIDFNGVIETENGTFMADFVVPNSDTIPTGQCGASGILVLVITEITPTPPIQCEYVQVAGRVTDYGNTSAFGRLSANAKFTNTTAGLVNNVTNANVCWAPLFGPIVPLWNKTDWNNPNATQTFTYSFYAARLINTTMTALNYSGYDFYVSGLWTVLNITYTYSGVNWCNFNASESSVAQNVTGELMVNGNWNITANPGRDIPCRTNFGNFTLSLTGFNDVTGFADLITVHARAVLDGDVLNHGVVDIYDLVYVAKCAGTTAGSPQSGGLQNFEGVEKADVNFDFHVDIYDLVTVSTELGQTG